MSSKTVNGSVTLLSCHTCGCEFPVFEYEVESDTGHIGLYSAGLCGGKGLLLLDLDFEEWKQADAGDMPKVPERFLPYMGGDDYRLTHIVRIETPPRPPAGLSFAELIRQYKRPTVVYACPCCGTGEATERTEMMPADYRNYGGQITVPPSLTLVE